ARTAARGRAGRPHLSVRRRAKVAAHRALYQGGARPRRAAHHRRPAARHHSRDWAEEERCGPGHAHVSGATHRGQPRARTAGGAAMKNRFLALWTVAVFAAGAAFVTYLALRFETVRLGYELDVVTKEQKRLNEWKRMVQLEAQTLREHQRIEAIAQHTLHMAAP